MSAAHTEDIDAPIPLDYDVDDLAEDQDAVGVALLLVIDGIATTLQAVNSRPADLAEAGLKQDHVDALEAAFRVGQRVLDEPGSEAVAREGFDALDPAHATDVRDTIVPFARLFDVELPADVAPEYDPFDHLAIDAGADRRGS